MAKELPSTDITTIKSVPDLLHLVEEVQRSHQPHLLTRDDKDMIILSPVGGRSHAAPTRRRRATAIPRSDSIFGIIGMVKTEGPTDVSENKHRYLADAHYEEFNPAKEL